MIVLKSECSAAKPQALTLGTAQVFLNWNVIGAGEVCWRRAIGAAYTWRMDGKAAEY
jgi:hypothetical protein